MSACTCTPALYSKIFCCLFEYCRNLQITLTSLLQPYTNPSHSYAHGLHYDKEYNVTALSGTPLEELPAHRNAACPIPDDGDTQGHGEKHEKGLIGSKTLKQVNSQHRDLKFTLGFSKPEGFSALAPVASDVPGAVLHKPLMELTTPELKSVILAHHGSATGMNKPELMITARALLEAAQEMPAADFFDYRDKSGKVMSGVDFKAGTGMGQRLEQLLQSGDSIAPKLRELIGEVIAAYQDDTVVTNIDEICDVAPELNDSVRIKLFSAFGGSKCKLAVDSFAKLAEQDKVVHIGVISSPANGTAILLSMQSASLTKDESTRKETPEGEKPDHLQYVVITEVRVEQTLDHPLGLATQVLRKWCMCKAGESVCVHQGMNLLTHQHIHNPGRAMLGIEKPATDAVQSWNKPSPLYKFAVTEPMSMTTYVKIEIDHLDKQRRTCREALHFGRRSLHLTIPHEYRSLYKSRTPPPTAACSVGELREEMYTSLSASDSGRTCLAKLTYDGGFGDREQLQDAIEDTGLHYSAKQRGLHGRLAAFYSASAISKTKREIVMLVLAYSEHGESEAELNERLQKAYGSCLPPPPPPAPLHLPRTPQQTAKHTPTQMLSAVVPEGATPGDTFQLAVGSAGASVEVTVPMDKSPGDSFDAYVPQSSISPPNPRMAVRAAGARTRQQVGLSETPLSQQLQSFSSDDDDEGHNATGGRLSTTHTPTRRTSKRRDSRRSPQRVTKAATKAATKATARPTRTSQRTRTKVAWR